ncbi:MAG: hypothetical protein ABIJ56_11330 [Pseudomonadota bacterium]
MHRLIVILPVLLVLVISSNCKRKESNFDKLWIESIYNKSRDLTRVTKGMKERDVAALLGEPDKMWAEGMAGNAGHAGTKYTWAFGVDETGSFARAGIVAFDANGEVVLASSPVIPDSPRASFLDVTLSRKAVRADSGMVCTLELASANPPMVRATLTNEGGMVYNFKHDNTGVAGNLLLEVFDEDRNIFFKDDLMTYHSPVYADPSMWPVMTIVPGQSVSEELPVFGGRAGRFGRVPKGTYYVHVAFPFETTRFYPSNLVKIEMGAQL